MVRVLVVDDSSAIRLAVRGILESLGMQVSEAVDGQEALDAVERDGCPDVMLLDWNMPNVNGLECLQQFRANTNNDDCCVVMCTTESDFDRIAEALEAGANEYVMKPFDKNIIAGKLEALGVNVNS